MIYSKIKIKSRINKDEKETEINSVPLLIDDYKNQQTINVKKNKNESLKGMQDKKLELIN